jgi:hypothetical protein
MIGWLRRAYYETFGGDAYVKATGFLYSEPLNGGWYMLPPTV